MSIPAVSATYLSQGPTADKQILAFSGLSAVELAYIGTGTATLDGAATSFTLNFIDGTAALTFTPSAVAAMVVGGTQPAASFVSVSTDTITTTGCVVRLSAAGSNANTLKIAFFILK